MEAHMSERTWSPQQSAVFEWAEHGTGNMVVRARAGTGKTTTILEAINRAPESSILLCAFNKRIAEELTTKLRNPRAVAKTLHSLGFSFIRRTWTNVKVDEDRAWRIARECWGMIRSLSGADNRPRTTIAETAPDAIITAVVKLTALGKNAAPLASLSDLIDLADTYNVQPDNGWADEVTTEELATVALACMQRAQRRDGSVDFDDMIYLPVVLRMTRPSFDLVVVDEAQDMNASQLMLAKAVASGRICVVGDDRQAIYGFRGADSDALDHLKDELHATELPLTVTYRCPSAIVSEAAKIVPDYQAAPGNVGGDITRTGEGAIFTMAAPTDFVLSRTNAPLARICLTLLRNGKRARIEGRDVSKGLVSLVKRMKCESIPELMTKLATWRDRETAKLAATKRKAAETRIEYVRDQVETLEALTDGLADTTELIGRIEELFSAASGPAIICSTVHKAKGLEADRVFILTDTLYCNGKRLDSREEQNIHYVALTRAKRSLVLVTREDN
jgi:ATP-dependent DNA helicase UvrD/PcrA